MYISLRIDPYTFYTTYANILIGNLPKVYVNRLSSPSLSKKKIPFFHSSECVLYSLEIFCTLLATISNKD